MRVGKSSALIISELKSSIDRLHAQIDKPSLSPRERRLLESEMRSVIDALSSFIIGLDPISHPTSVFDPGNPKIVGRFIAIALVAQPKVPLSKALKTYGSGVYALYYKGPIAEYAPISNTETPIYVGQAAPALSNARSPLEQGDRLSRRLDDHRKNILKASSTIDLLDFEYRSLVVQSGWETAAEDYLINLFQPIWNSEVNILYGLGKHGDAAHTRGNKRSPWDTFHPGRAWAAASKEDAKSLDQMRSELKSHFQTNPAFLDVASIIENFIEELRQA